ncbi:MAG: tyrosine-type recombinase/integrase [Opitutus sp.]
MDDETLSQHAKIKSEISQQDPEVSATSRLGKTHEDYWKGRLRRRTYQGPGGETRAIPEWQVQLAKGGRQRWVNLETANKGAAAKKARDAWLKLQTLGWDAVKPAKEKILDPNIGQFLAAVRAEADLASGTFEIYAKKFRRLVSGVFGIRGGRQKHDYAAGGYAKWLARVESVKFSRLTARSVQRWKTRYIAAAATNPLRERRARRTIASVLRSSKALFAPAVIEKLQMQLPVPLPLACVDVPRVSVAQYVSHISPDVLFQQAQRELESPSIETLSLAVTATANMGGGNKSAPKGRQYGEATIAQRIARMMERERAQRHQAFRMFCLALFAGLRRDEIDSLTWAQIDFAGHVIRIETNEFTRAKSEGSETGVDIDPTLSEMLRDWMADSKTKFVIETDVEPRPEVTSYHHYRCNAIFKKLTTWLKSHEVEDRNALHALRKEFGTQINRSHGLFAASAALRHSSIQLTRSVYVAKKDRAVFKLPSAGQAVGVPEIFFFKEAIFR